MKQDEKTYPSSLRAGNSQRPPAQTRVPSQTRAAIPEAALSTAAPPLPRSPHGGSAPSRPASVTPAARPWRQAPPVRGRGFAARLGSAARSAMWVKRRPELGLEPTRPLNRGPTDRPRRRGPGAASRPVSPGA